MPLGTPYLPETTTSAIGSGQHQELTAAALVSKFGSANVKTPTRNFAINLGGHAFTGRKNVPFVTSPEMLASLLAAGAPIV